MPRISVNGLATGSASLAEDVALCQTLSGRTGDGVRLCVPRHKLPATVTPLAVGVSAVLHPSAFSLDEPAAWAAERVALSHSVDAAAVLDASCVYLTTGPGWQQPWEAGAQAFAEAVRPVAEYAGTRGIRLAVEPTNPLRTDIGIVHTLRDAVDLAYATDLDVCVEFYACWYERGLRDTLRRAAGRIALVQISDFVLGTTDMPNRAVPGDGVIPLERLIGAVLEDGYRGAFDLELLGVRIEAEGPPAALGRGVDWLQAVLRGLGSS
jgi:sugar phosphate isomerase/epimerase